MADRATAALYAGGVVLNDVFDRDLDRIERPERPIPSGRVGTPRAAALGGGLLAPGVASGAAASRGGRVRAGHCPPGPALRRLGQAPGTHRAAQHGALPCTQPDAGRRRRAGRALGGWPIAAVPLLYIYAVTVLSRGEVHGGSRRAASSALIILVTSIGALLLVMIRTAERPLRR